VVDRAIRRLLERGLVVETTKRTPLEHVSVPFGCDRFTVQRFTVQRSPQNHGSMNLER
jgi:hypothetical protein